ncbi:acyltransferase family protein [Tessaracoccus sp. ZS01]|uniref:acyltransferase family protein n=1 Tax=Tessaracoccus sp. ZS01 TaxID=1906324 RepID=UPI0035194572
MRYSTRPASTKSAHHAARARVSPEDRGGAVAQARTGAARGDIEGLRAIAVAWVVLFHLSATMFPGGFAGVDVFFVISGFLITWQMVKEWERSGTVNIPRFYARRARRLLPAATVVLVFTAVAGWLILPPSEHRFLAIDIGASALYVINWVLAARSVDYLATDVGAIPSAVQHYWTLSVEEQFYLIWPLLILLGLIVARRLGARRGSASTGDDNPQATFDHRRRVVGILLCAVALASFAWSIWHTSGNSANAYFVTTTRIWELAIGALIAIAMPWLIQRINRTVANALSAVGIAAVLATAVVVTTYTPWPGYAALLPTLGCAAVVIAGCAHPDTWVARALGVAPMRLIGGLSYSIYLWHWPLFIFAELHSSDRPWLLPLAAALSVVGAWLTKHFVEDPLRFHRRVMDSTKVALAMGAAGMALSLAAAGLLLLASPKTVEPASRPDALASDAASSMSGDSAAESGADSDAQLWGPMAYVDVSASRGLELVERADPQAAWTTSGPLTPAPESVMEDLPATYADKCQLTYDEVQPRTSCIYGDTDSDHRVLLLGDSKANQWFSPFEAIAEREGWRLEVHTKSACSIETGVVSLDGKPYQACRDWSMKVLEDIEANPPALVIYSQGRGIPAVESQRLSSQLARVTAAGSRLVIVDDSMTSTLDNGQRPDVCLQLNSDDYSACMFKRGPGGASAVLEAVAKDLRASFLPAMDWVCPRGVDRCSAAVGQVPVFRQGTHITDTYAVWMAPWFHRELIKIGAADTQPMPIS